VVKQRTERNLLFPSKEFRDCVRLAAKERSFRSEHAFILAACKNELARGDSTEATARLEARIAATLANKGKQVQSLFTLVHAQFALTNSLLQYVLTCVVEPPEEVLPAARARAKARYANILRLAGQEVATRNKATLEEVLSQGKQQ
jgi:ABC-type histidine transport system ATPase subunit